MDDPLSLLGASAVWPGRYGGRTVWLAGIVVAARATCRDAWSYRTPVMQQATVRLGVPWTNALVLVRADLISLDLRGREWEWLRPMRLMGVARHKLDVCDTPQLRRTSSG